MKIHTIGYGNNMPDKLIGRLKKPGVTYVFDVRRSGSMSWLRSGEYNQGHKMRLLLKKHGIEYIASDDLSNRYDTLDGYKEWLDSECGKREIRLLCRTLVGLGDFMPKIFVPCLLCCELDYTKCHRQYVAEAIAEKTGWEIVHL